MWILYFSIYLQVLTLHGWTGEPCTSPRTFSWCDIETYPLLCSRIKPACILQQTLYAARLVFWPPVQDTIIVWLCLALEDNEQCVLRLILPYKRLWWWPLRSVICQYPLQSPSLMSLSVRLQKGICPHLFCSHHSADGCCHCIAFILR